MPGRGTPSYAGDILVTVTWNASTGGATNSIGGTLNLDITELRNANGDLLGSKSRILITGATFTDNPAG